MRPTRLRATDAPPGPDNGPYVLTVHAPGRSPFSVRLVEGEQYTIGRSPSSEIVLDHSWVSARHAVIAAGEPPYIVDVGSRNSTYVDGQRIEPQTRRALAAGSLISIGGFSLLVTRGEDYTSGTVRRAVPAVLRGRGASASSAGSDASAEEGAPILRDRRMLELYSFASKVAKSSVNVLITGETGAGKELMAQAIHKHSWRGERELVTLNCAAIPDNLVESELFGYERGAFSGAGSAKPGLFEVASGSTFFMDEIGELPIGVQAKLLRVLETGEVLRLGAVRPTRVDVRIVAATNRHLPTLVAAGAFRADLFYRLNGLTLAIPPLRERPDDIEHLARHFAARAANGRDVPIADDAIARLKAYAWPGNVRELKSVVERAVLVRRHDELDALDLAFDGSMPLPPVPGPELSGPGSRDGAARGDLEVTERFTTEELPTSVVRAELERRERRRLKEALERTGGNQSEAAVLLGISRRTLMNRMDRYSMSRPRKGGGRSDEG